MKMSAVRSMKHLDYTYMTWISWSDKNTWLDLNDYQYEL